MHLVHHALFCSSSPACSSRAASPPHRHAVRHRPVVRATGGLADTVHDYNHSTRPRDQRNGYAFHHTDNQTIESALSRALQLHTHRPREFTHLAANCMTADHSWIRPAHEYLDIYQHIRHK